MGGLIEIPSAVGKRRPRPAPLPGSTQAHPRQVRAHEARHAGLGVARMSGHGLLSPSWGGGVPHSDNRIRTTCLQPCLHLTLRDRFGSLRRNLRHSVRCVAHHPRRRAWFIEVAPFGLRHSVSPSAFSQYRSTRGFERFGRLRCESSKLPSADRRMMGGGPCLC
jgi:hypothetical protein